MFTLENIKDCISVKSLEVTFQETEDGFYIESVISVIQDGFYWEAGNSRGFQPEEYVNKWRAVEFVGGKALFIARSEYEEEFAKDFEITLPVIENEEDDDGEEWWRVVELVEAWLSAEIEEAA